ncbi:MULTISPECIES: EF-P 5-aminopentanol modification-associated protein YfmH [unclassified Streptococcus]|uniref:EF-P 5-aminopentanol modification-associated protein YfmH n=1 Tax=unclassified Streptococcus TaxID=2608887 RepID=UPI00359CE01B
MALEQIAFPHLNETIYQGILPSGLRLIVIPKSGFKENIGMLSVRFGGIDTEFTVNDQKIATGAGLAHFLEHQVFENNGKQDFSQKFTGLGSDSNAFTSFTTTNYFFSSVDQLNENLELLIDLVSQPRFTENSIKKEQSIISQEIDMYQDDPDYRLYSSLLAGLFPETPLAVDLAGKVDSIAKITLTDLSNAFETFYRPEGMTLVVIGDVDENVVYKRLTDLTSQMIQQTPVRVSRSAISYQPVVKKQSLQLDVNMPKLGIGFRHEPIQDSSLFYKTALKLYLNMLIGWTSKTYQQWYDDGKINDSFDVVIEVDERFQFVMVLLDTNEPIAMSAKIKQALKKGKSSKDVSEERLFSLKKELYGEFLMSLDRPDELASAFLEHSTQELFYLDVPDILDQLTLENVLLIGETFFHSADIAEVTIFPL